MVSVVDAQFEHYRAPNTLGVEETKPRLSWRFKDAPSGFQQLSYEVELSEDDPVSKSKVIAVSKQLSPLNTLVPWPFREYELQSRLRIGIRVRVWDQAGNVTAWSAPAFLEIGLLHSDDWSLERITAPWAPAASAAPDGEHLYRREFSVSGPVARARLYITAQGVYETEINGQRVGDHFMAPGWTSYDGRLQYQTYDVTDALANGPNCLGARVAEGWFCGRIGFAGGNRNIWGTHPALMAQLEITYSDGQMERICTDGSWSVARGPIQRAEIYDGERYDATREVPFWSSVSAEHPSTNSEWEPASVLPPLETSTRLTAGFSEPVRRVQYVKPQKKIVTPSGKTVFDFGQNLVGYLHVKNIKGRRGDKLKLTHAEVLENEELSIRPLRICKATDEYTLKGSPEGEQYAPRFTFHGFRFAQIEGCEIDLDSVEAVVCHTDMGQSGSFSCSKPLLNRLHENISWSMCGNFLSVPTDCPQRDERLGYLGDLCLFAPAGVLIYDCYNMLRNWLIDVEHDQGLLNGVPPMISPNSTQADPVWYRKVPCAIWHDATILTPWILYQETGDKSILAQQWNSMATWMRVLPRDKDGLTHLWDQKPYQLGDWVDPSAPPDKPWKGATDAKMVANMFLIQSLDLIAQIADILNKPSEAEAYRAEAIAARKQFQEEYVTANGRVISDSQAAYALAICFDILTPTQRVRAGKRLAELVRRNNLNIGTGFAGTPFILEALATTGYLQVAYAMLLEKSCPSWLYPITMGATTMWERWDSMLPDGSVNPGEMTSFNHYAFGAVGKFLHERVAGLKRLEPGWKRCRVQPAVGAEFTSGASSHETANGTIACSWKTTVMDDGSERMKLDLTVPYGTTAEVVLPAGKDEGHETVGAGVWTFESTFKREYQRPVLPLKPKEAFE